MSVLWMAAMVMLCSCATPSPPQAFHSLDKSVVVIKSLNQRFSQVIAPTLMAETPNTRTLEQLKSLSPRAAVVVILEDYFEPVLGTEFRDRSVEWMLTLRLAGFQHIIFLKGNGVADPEGLPILAQYF